MSDTVPVAVLLAVAAQNVGLRSGVLLAVAVALLGMAAGRVVSFCFERAGRWPWVFLATESVLAGLLLWER